MARGGYIKSHRAILDSWFQKLKPEYYKLGITLLHMANWEQSTTRDGNPVEAGELITSIDGLVEMCKPGVSRDQVKRGLSRLQTAGLIALRPTRKFTRISIVNWHRYQAPPDTTALLTAPQTAPQTAPIKEVKEHKEVKEAGGSATDKPVARKSKLKAPPTDDALKLTDYLRRCITTRDPDGALARSFPTSRRNSWAKTFDKMLSIDKLLVEEIVAVIKWTFSLKPGGNLSREYQMVILSPKSLQRKFIEAQASMKRLTATASTAALPAGTVSARRHKNLTPSQIDALAARKESA